MHTVSFHAIQSCLFKRYPTQGDYGNQSPVTSSLTLLIPIIEIKCTWYKLKYQDFTLTDISMNKALSKPDVSSLLWTRKETHKLHLSSARQLCRFLYRPAVKGSFNYILPDVGKNTAFQSQLLPVILIRFQNSAHLK